MSPHLTHMGVHDHGFNNVSTYGTLWRLAREGRIERPPGKSRFYELALKVSGAVQARRWTELPDGGFIHSFNGAHSLFVDTIRSLRALALGHVLGQRLMEEQDASVSLLDRLIDHARATAQYNVYFGRGRDAYDVRGRTAHESLFNVASGTYRGPEHAAGLLAVHAPGRAAWPGRCSASPSSSSSSPRCPDEAPDTSMLLDAATATCDHYIDEATAADGIPYWDAGAPGLAAHARLARSRPPIRSTTTSRSTAPPRRSRAQGLLRLAHVLAHARPAARGRLYMQAGLRVAETLFEESGPYLSTDPKHQGLLLHSVYHRPNNWDHVPRGGHRRAARRASGATTTRARSRST